MDSLPDEIYGIIASFLTYIEALKYAESNTIIKMPQVKRHLRFKWCRDKIVLNSYRSGFAHPECPRQKLACIHIWPNEKN